ncbi:MAG: cobalamin-binding protein [Candidatus Velthaea sp.]
MILAAILAATIAATRIISLAPAITEDLYAIGAGPHVVGVDGNSNRPPAARALPHVGSMRTVNTETILALHPDLVVGIPYSAPELTQLARIGIPTRALKVDTLADDFATISELGRLSGRARAAQALVAALTRRMSTLRAASAHLAAPSALIVVSTKPIYTAGNGSYIADLLRYANVRNVTGGLHSAFPSVSDEVVEATDPDVIITTPGMPIPSGPPWSRLRAVREHRIIVLPEDDLFRPGPHVADVLDALVRAIAPYRAGAAANVTTRPSGSRRTAIGMP